MAAAFHEYVAKQILKICEQDDTHRITSVKPQIFKFHIIETRVDVSSFPIIRNYRYTKQDLTYKHPIVWGLGNVSAPNCIMYVITESEIELPYCVWFPSSCNY